MLFARDNLSLAADAIRAHRLRASLTILGLTMGVATLITVMTLVQGANRYVEEKIANLGTNVFRVSRMPFAVTDFNVVVKAMRYKRLDSDDLKAVEAGCVHCQYVGASASTTMTTHYREHELQDTTLYGHTSSMAMIDTRTLTMGRYFTEVEDRHGVAVCLIGENPRKEFFPSVDPIGRVLRVGSQEFTVIGVFDRIGSVLGQDQDNFLVIPLTSYLRMRGVRNSLLIHAKTADSGTSFQMAQDEARMVLRARRHITGNQEESFFIGTSESYIALWQSISSAFFAVFVMVSSISAVVGGIVIMNVMLVSVTERTKEIGIRRAVGATQSDVLRQFLAESVMQCLAGGAAGVGMGFGCALALREFTSFPASVRTWVALTGLALSSAIGLFFGIYPALKAAKLDPVTALRAE